MKLAAIILLVGVFVRHAAANWLSEDSALSPAAWFYVLGGAWEFTLCALLLWIAMGYRYSIWRGLMSAAMMIGMLEAAQMSSCRVAVGGGIKSVPTSVNLCDHITGLPVGAVMLTVYLLMIAWHVGRYIRERAS